MMRTISRQQRRELGDFVRSLRERLHPADIGLPHGGRRRTPGLRREEAAQLCGLSVTWYTWLEQGREMSLSSAALSRLSGALRLGRAERAYLFELAATLDPDMDDQTTVAVPQSVMSCLDLIATPAYVLDRTWTARAWNPAAAHLFAGWLDGAKETNLLRFIFLTRSAKTLIRDHENRARRVVAEFRADVSAHLADPAIARLVNQLEASSADFRRYWDERLVLGRDGGQRTFRHPLDGLLTYEQVTFVPAGHPDLKLTMLVVSPP